MSEKYPQNDIKIITDPLELVRCRPGMYFEKGANLMALEAMIHGIWMTEQYHVPMGGKKRRWKFYPRFIFTEILSQRRITRVC